MPSGGWIEVGERARRQFGVVSLPQLRELGFDDRSVSRAVAQGHLLRLHRGVFAVGHRPTQRSGYLLAALIVAGPDGAISHRPAAEFMGILKPSGGLIDVTVPTRAGRSMNGIRWHRSRLAADERVLVGGIRCTSASRTILDLAQGPAGLLERAIREAGGLGLLDASGIAALLERYPRRSGSRALRRLMKGTEPVPAFTRSRLERRIYPLCRHYGLPVPQMNVPIPAGDTVYEADCVWPEHRLIVECDSRWHDNPASAVEDAQRDQALTLAGWRVHRLRWAQIVGAPERAAQTIRKLLHDQELLLRSLER